MKKKKFNKDKFKAYINRFERDDTLYMYVIQVLAEEDTDSKGLTAAIYYYFKYFQNNTTVLAMINSLSRIFSNSDTYKELLISMIGELGRHKWNFENQKLISLLIDGTAIRKP